MSLHLMLYMMLPSQKELCVRDVSPPAHQPHPSTHTDTIPSRSADLTKPRENHTNPNSQILKNYNCYKANGTQKKTQTKTKDLGRTEAMIWKQKLNKNACQQIVLPKSLDCFGFVGFPLVFVTAIVLKSL